MNLLALIAVTAAGYFVDIYDLLLFSIVRVKSLKELGELTSSLLAAHQTALELAVDASRSRLLLIQWIVLGALAAIPVAGTIQVILRDWLATRATHSPAAGSG